MDPQLKSKPVGACATEEAFIEELIIRLRTAILHLTSNIGYCDSSLVNAEAIELLLTILDDVKNRKS